MRKSILLLSALCFTLILNAQVNQMLGNWKTIDDKTGEARSIVNIYKGSDGLYYGKIVQLLVEPFDALCVPCEGEDHNKPVVGLVIIHAMQAEDGVLRGGKVLDPESGKFYYGKISLDNGKLVLRGSLDKRGFIGRNQTWLRAN